MHYNVEDLGKPHDVFAVRFTLPLWNYVVPPRKPVDSPYIVDLDFGVDPLTEFLQAHTVVDKDVLEVFELRRRVLVTGVKVRILEPAQSLVIRPVMNSEVYFDAIDCSERTDKTYLLGGG